MHKLYYILIISVLWSGCRQAPDIDSDIVSVSILPQKQLVEMIAGSHLEINVLIPPGASPATYEPTPKQIINLSNSSLYFRIGYIEFEKNWLSKIESANPDLKLINTAENIDLIKGKGHRHGNHYHEGGIDPHIWMSPKRIIEIAINIEKALSAEYPGNEKVYKQNLELLIDSVKNIDAKLEQTLYLLENKKFLIFHPALTYFANDYGLEQIPIEYEGKSPSAEYIKKIVDKAKTEGINIVLIQKEFDVENATSIANEINARVVQINPLNKNWFVEMNHLLSVFSNNL